MNDIIELRSRDTYQEYKDSGVEWLGKVPAHWEMRRLKSVVNIRNGATPKTSRQEYWDGTILWVTPSDLGRLRSQRIAESAKKITSEGYASCGTTLAPRNSIVVSTRAPIGHVAILDSRGCTNQGCKLLVSSTGVVPEYLYWLLKSARSALRCLGQGTTFTELSQRNLGCFRLPIPPVSEQDAIASFLNHQTARIDKLIEKKQHLMELLDEKRSAMISEAVMGAIDVRTGASYPEYKECGIEWLREIPVRWKSSRLKRLMGNVADLTTFKNRAGIFLALENVESWTGEFTITEHTLVPESQSKKFREGDILFGKLNPYLAKVVRPNTSGCCVSEFLVLRLRRESFDSRYAEYLLRSKAVINTINSLARGVKMPRTEWPSIGNIIVPHPSLLEQASIAKFLTTKISHINAIKSKVQFSLKRLEEYRDELIADVVTGQTDTRGWIAGNES